MLKFNFLPRFSVIIVFTFIVFTIIGTQLHELGHIVVAKYYGYETELHHDSMKYFQKGLRQDVNYIEFNSLNEKYQNWNINDVPQGIKDKSEALYEKIKLKYPPRDDKSSLYISIAGPVQTILTSVLGFIILLYRRKLGCGFKLLDWLGIFLALFILRKVFNFCSGISSLILSNPQYFSGDEFQISRQLSFNQWVIPTIMFVVGIFLSVYVIFKIIPLKFRFSFIISGFVGGLLGFGIWFGFLGEWIFSFF